MLKSCYAALSNNSELANYMLLKEAYSLNQNSLLWGINFNLQEGAFVDLNTNIDLGNIGVSNIRNACMDAVLAKMSAANNVCFVAAVSAELLAIATLNPFYAAAACCMAVAGQIACCDYAFATAVNDATNCNGGNFQK